MIQVKQNRTHPMVLIAATGLTIFSILGSAAITGLIPSVHHQSTQNNASDAKAQNTMDFDENGDLEKASTQIDNAKRGEISELGGLLTQKNVILPLPMPNLQAVSKLKLNTKLGLGIEADHNSANINPIEVKKSFQGNYNTRRENWKVEKTDSIKQIIGQEKSGSVRNKQLPKTMSPVSIEA